MASNKFLPWNPVTSRRDTSRFATNPFGINFDPTSTASYQGADIAPISIPDRRIPTGGSIPQTGGVNLQAPPADTTPSFLDQYNKLAGNRPNRMAYQEAVQSGPPEIKRGKWAKLGAAIAAGGSALGGMPADRAAAFGISSYKQPQERSDELYNKRVAGLAQSAQFEDSDLQDRMSALDKQHGYDTQDREYRRQLDKDWEDKIDNVQRRKVGEQQLEAGAQAIEDSKWLTYEDPKDGMTKRISKDGSGKSQVLGHTGWSADEATANKVKEAVAQYQALYPFKQKEDFQNFFQNVYLKQMEIDAQTAKTTAASEAKKAAALAAIRAKVAMMDPADKMGHVYNFIGKAIAENKLDPSAMNYVGIKNNVINSDAMMWGADSTTKAGVDEIIANVMSGKAFTGEAGGGTTQAAGGTTATPAAKPEAKPAAASEQDYSFTPTASHTVKMVNPDGKEFYTQPQNIEQWKEGGARVIDAPGIPGKSTQAAATVTPDVGRGSMAASMAAEADAPGSTLGRSAGVINKPTPPAAPIPRTDAASRIAGRPTMLGMGAPIPTSTPQATAPNGGARTTMIGRNPPLPPAQAGPTGTPVPGVNIPPPAQPQPNQLMHNPIQLAPNAQPAPPVPNAPPPPIQQAPPQQPQQQASPLMHGQIQNPIKLGPSMQPTQSHQTPAQEFDSKLSKVRERVKAETGLDVVPISKVRSAAEQAALYAKGRTTGAKGKTVTNADGVEKKSKHQDGRAADLRFVGADGKKIEGSEAMWKVLGKIAKEEGLTWGGDWKDPYDPLHVEWR